MYLPKHIQNLQPYKPGKSIRDAEKEYGISKWVKLASNENPRGVSPKAKAAALEAISRESHIYPHPRSPELLEALARKFKRKEEEIICGNGVDSLLAYIIMAFTYEGEEVLTSQGSFIGIYVNVKKLGRILQTVPLKNYAYDLDGILASVTKSTKIVYLSNPNNPTGTIFKKKEWENFLKKLPSQVIVILDEAYYEYACDDPEYPNGLNYPLDRLIVTRTFSKAYGMANMRVGYAFSSPKIIAEIQKVKLPFEPSSISTSAAVAALDDHEFLSTTQKLNKEGLAYFKKEFERMKIPFVQETRANFFMLAFDNEVEAMVVSDECLENGLILRPLQSFGINSGVRINTGTMEENKFAVAVIEKILQGRNKK